MTDPVEFTIKVSMDKRWVPHFLGLLREMQTLGEIGSSRTVCFFADGDGDYRPRFEWDTKTEPAPPAKHLLWDAG
jgi:hypothetical protein